MSAALPEGAPLLLLLSLILTGLLVAALVLLRISRDAWATRRERRRRAVREVLFAALMGDPDEALEARSELSRRHGASWAVAEEQAFSMLSKIKGHSRVALVQVLLDKGAGPRAVQKTSSWSLVRRCRGAYELGALGQRDAVPVLLPMLDDRSFLVRRVAVRALGAIGDSAAVVALLQVTGEEPRLTNDLVYALDRIGPPAAPALRSELERALTQRQGGGRHADLAAIGLGMVGDVEAVPLLTEAVRSGRPSLQSAAARALGRIGMPEAVVPLTLALESSDPTVRVSAAAALGEIGDPGGAAALARALAAGHHEVSRESAAALLRVDDEGRRILEESGSPYAAEALAVAGLRHGV